MLICSGPQRARLSSFETKLLMHSKRRQAKCEASSPLRQAANSSDRTMPPPGLPSIRIAAGLIVNGAGRVLLVRKRGTTAFMQAGGKIEPHESPTQALARELEEELGICVAPDAPEYLGEFTAQAANETDRKSTRLNSSHHDTTR